MYTAVNNLVNAFKSRTYIRPNRSVIIPYCLLSFGRRVARWVLNHGFAVLEIREGFLVQGVNIRDISENFNVHLRCTILYDRPEIFFDDSILLGAP